LFQKKILNNFLYFILNFKFEIWNLIYCFQFNLGRFVPRWYRRGRASRQSISRPSGSSKTFVRLLASGFRAEFSGRDRLRGELHRLLHSGRLVENEKDLPDLASRSGRAGSCHSRNSGLDLRRWHFLKYVKQLIKTNYKF